MPGPTRSLLAMMMTLILLAGACSQGNDPESWSEAQQDGNLRENFLKACKKANGEAGEDGEIEFSASQLGDYCGCAFGTVVEYYGGALDGEDRLSDEPSDNLGRDFEAFRELENSLRDDPEQLPADLEVQFLRCKDRALGIGSGSRIGGA